MDRTLARIVTAVALVALLAHSAVAQEGQFLSEAQAPAAVFAADATFTREVIAATPSVKDTMRALLGTTEPSIWEDEYVTFKATQGETLLGYAVIVEEIGKHRPITFVVGVRRDGTVNDVAVMAYREAYGGEVKARRFLNQYRGKTPRDALQAPADIKNIAGATLSVDAASRAVKKAMALAHVAFGIGAAS
jgi:Na+-translocating ferredoxin:NAD+ oxidoreductase RnfG subunit